MSSTEGAIEGSLPTPSRSGVNTPRHLAPPGSALEELIRDFQPGHEPIIAVDMDDVLSQTNNVVAKWHNEAYGTNMTLDDFLYYHYWKNPYWGTPDETFRKVEEFWKTNWIEVVPPIPGSVEGTRKLRALGYRLIVITARQKRELHRANIWLQTHFPEIFDGIICTGQSQETLGESKETLTKLSKAGVCHKIGAKILIDDSLENTMKCAEATPPVPALLFGDFAWNQRESHYDDIKTELSFDQRMEKEGGHEWWKDEKVVIPEGVPLIRVKDWEAVVQWVEQERHAGRL